MSVVIPSYNSLKSTLRAIRSALHQTQPPAEVVVVDDASQPALDQELLQSLDRRVRVHRLPQNGGAAFARQTAVDHAGGDVIAFLDSDDYWEPHKLAEQLPLLEAATGVLVAVTCGWIERTVDGREWRRRMPVGATDPSAFVSGCWFCPGSTVILRKSVFDVVGPFDTALRRLEDLDWFGRFGVAGGRLLVARSTMATISIGARSRYTPVHTAAATIMDKPVWEALAPADLRAMHAWLNVERARALQNEKRHIRAAALLARSFVTVPRTRVQLRRWWQADLGGD